MAWKERYFPGQLAGRSRQVTPQGSTTHCCLAAVGDRADRETAPAPQLAGQVAYALPQAARPVACAHRNTRNNGNVRYSASSHLVCAAAGCPATVKFAG